MNNGQIWNESSHGGRLVRTTDYRGTVTFLSLFTSHTIWYLASGPPMYCHPFIHYCFCFHSGPAENQVGKARLQFSVFLHADTMQQLELALLGSPSARLLDVMGTQHQTTSSHSTSVPLCPSTTLSTPFLPPSVPIAGITDMEGPVEAKASTSKILPPTMSADIEAASPKCCQIIPLPIPTTTSRSSSLPSKLPVISYSQACSPGACPS